MSYMANLDIEIFEKYVDIAYEATQNILPELRRQYIRKEMKAWAHTHPKGDLWPIVEGWLNEKFARKG